MSPERKPTRGLLLLTRSNGFVSYFCVQILSRLTILFPQRISRIQSTLSSDLDHLFSDTTIALSTGKLPEDDKAKRMADLTECLRTYDALQLWRDAEDVLRRDVLREFVKKVSDVHSQRFVEPLLTLTASRTSFLARFTHHMAYFSHKRRSRYTKMHPSPVLRGPPTSLSRPLRRARTLLMLHSQRRLALMRQTTRLLICTTAYSHS